MFSYFIVILKKNQILMVSLVRKRYCIMIRSIFMTLPKRNEGGKSCILTRNSMFYRILNTPLMMTAARY